MPTIEEIINKIAQYKIYNTKDIHCAYYLIPLSKADCPYTTFEGN